MRVSRLGLLGLLVLGGVTGTDLVFGVGLAGLLGVVYIAGNVDFDACPNCRMEVSATGDRYCATCGARLDELEAAPPLDERGDERHRPVNLKGIERSPDVGAIADGGEFNKPEDEEVSS